MNKHTIETIKQTICYKANIKAIKAVYPDHWHLFAHELMVAANATTFIGYKAMKSKTLLDAFYWAKSPQGRVPWSHIYCDIEEHHRSVRKARNAART